jgi:NTP pyrophosphatase (non-canonical NTP hydrolase)
MIPMTFEQLRVANVMRLAHFKNRHGALAHAHPSGSDWTPAQWLQAVVGELGEYANLRKKVERGDYTIEEALPELGAELADVVIYLDLLAYRLGIDLGEAVREKWNRKSEQIGYAERL